MAMGVLTQAEFSSLSDACLGMTDEKIAVKVCCIARERAFEEACGMRQSHQEILAVVLATSCRHRDDVSSQVS